MEINSLERKYNFCEGYYKFEIFITNQNKQFQKSERLNGRKIAAFLWEKASNMIVTNMRIFL